MENVETQTNNIPVEENEQELSREEDFAELVESSFHKVQEGEVVTGIVVQVTADHVMVDVGSKTEGQIPVEQFTDEQGQTHRESRGRGQGLSRGHGRGFR